VEIGPRRLVLPDDDAGRCPKHKEMSMTTELARTREVKYDEAFEYSSDLTWRGITISVIGWLETERRDIAFRWRWETQGIYDGDVVEFMRCFAGEEPTLDNAARLVDAIAVDRTQDLHRYLSAEADGIERTCWEDRERDIAHEDDLQNWQRWGCWL
jgi:hypothetical protein